MKRLVLAFAILLAAGWRPASAQTAENLARAIQFYQGLEVERARDVFLQVISPSSPFQVTNEQRVTAYKYLGASLATLGQRDSATTYFQAAIERDPFADLDQTFTPQERAAFTQAKLKVFKVGARQVGWTATAPLGALTTIDPRSQTVKFGVVTTHAANLVVLVRNVDDGSEVALYAGENDGLREISWNGSLQRGGLVPTGPYELVVTGTSQRATGSPRDSIRVLFDILQQFAALEDTLRSITNADLLPELYTRSAALKNLMLGGIVAVMATAIPLVIGSGPLDMPPGPALGVAGLGALSGVLAYVSLTNRPQIPANVAENERRRAGRDQANRAIVDRNNAKLAQTRLLFTPIAATVQ